jgi:hypothetical protein
MRQRGGKGRTARPRSESVPLCRDELEFLERGTGSGEGGVHAEAVDDEVDEEEELGLEPKLVIRLSVRPGRSEQEGSQDPLAD